MKDQIKRLQGEIKQIGQTKEKVQPTAKREKGAVNALREKYLKSGKAKMAYRKDIKGDITASLAKFTRDLQQAKAHTKPSEPIKKDLPVCELHNISKCSSCHDTFGQAIEEDDTDWMSATLKFDKKVGANVYEPLIDDYSVEDPRAEAKAKKVDPFGRDLKTKGDAGGKFETRNWQERSTRKVRDKVDQAKEAPEYQRYQ